MHNYSFCYSNSGREYSYVGNLNYISFQTMCKYYLSWILPVIMLVGVLGSIFCLLFLTMSKLFPKTLLLWLISICIGDFMIIILDTMWMLLKMWIGLDIRDLNDIICVTHTFFSNYFFYWSSYMQALMSLQRVYLILRPIQARSSLSMSRLITIWCTISLLLVFPNILYLTRWRIVNGDCDPPNRTNYIITTLCDMVIWGIIPFISMVGSTIVICWNICNYQSKFHSTASKPSIIYSFVRFRTFSCTNNDTFYNQNDIEETDKSVDNTSFRSSPGSLRQPSTRHGGNKVATHVTQLLVSINIWYMLTTFPLLIFLMYLNFINPGIDDWSRKFFYYLFRSFSFFNACSNWFFYCATGRLFRSTAKIVMMQLFCQESQQEPNAIPTKNSQRSLTNFNSEQFTVRLKYPEIRHVKPRKLTVTKL